MLNRLHYEERRWFNWLEFAMSAEKNRWPIIRLLELVGRLASAQNIDNYQTYNGSVSKRKTEVNGSAYACDAYVPAES